MLDISNQILKTEPPPDVQKAYWEKRLQASFSLRNAGFMRLGERYNQWMYKITEIALKHILSGLLVKYDQFSILEIGAGTGFYIEQWRKMGVKKITGWDITRIATQNLSIKYPGYRFYQVDIGSELPSELRETYDIVSAFGILFHITDDSKYRRAIKNISAFTKPGGYFILSEDFIHGPTIRKHHIVCRSLEEISGLIESAGFEIIRRSPMHVLMNYPVDSQSRLAQWLWMVFGGLVSLSEVGGYVLGALVFPLEKFLVTHLKEGPTTEIMICRKKVL